MASWEISELNGGFVHWGNLSRNYVNGGLSFAMFDYLKWYNIYIYLFIDLYIYMHLITCNNPGIVGSGGNEEI